MIKPDEIREYHAHVYYRPEQKGLAAELREGVIEQFEVRMGRWHDRPVGPHPCSMYQIAFAPPLFCALLPWLMLNRRGLDILIHPETGHGHAGDHSERALWLGQPLAIDLELLRRYDAGELHDSDLLPPPA
ncbi:MAG: DOPA 4,5-dioxygenase family protein [Gammaproteobacteria bacterium]|nr:DOPA 4,5-dioxygenase family protein [Gammaproteobacteria bacterium]